MKPSVICSYNCTHALSCYHYHYKVSEVKLSKLEFYRTHTLCALSTACQYSDIVAYACVTVGTNMCARGAVIILWQHCWAPGTSGTAPRREENFGLDRRLTSYRQHLWRHVNLKTKHYTGFCDELRPARYRTDINWSHHTLL